MTKTPKTILAIDAVIGSGSVSLRQDGKELAFKFGNSQTPLSENLLSLVEALLHETDIEKNSIDTVATTIGPGSYTGIRVGVSTALGLKASLGCEIAGVPTLRVFAEAPIDADKDIVAATYAGGTDLIYQRFTFLDGKVEEFGTPEIGGVEIISTFGDSELFIDQGTIDKLDLSSLGEQFSAVDENIAGLVGSVVSKFGQKDFSKAIEPIYGREFGANKTR